MCLRKNYYCQRKGVIALDKKKHGIHCDVENCVYNHDAHECTANSIEVCATCDDPGCCDETICRTFEPKD
ncbi:MAG: DUF1540 domain-containing protein [Ruminococcus sp.]|nr:DUF1540 domain-containing protein [Ruminococcus sp.]MBP3798309.1 DUF1540 domain-containing protein [Ruminococcus sp.]MBQ1432823.1 DUF1540 domain-containing protein [Ruminococcus sp.]